MVSDLSQSKTSKTPRKATLWALTTAGILLLSVLVRVLWLHTFPSQPTAPVDAEGYFLLARNMLEGNGFSIAWEPPFCPNTVRTPLYPLFLTFSFLILGPTAQPIVLLHILSEVLTCAVSIRLGYSLGKLVSKNSDSRFFAGVLAGILYAINGTTQRYTGFLFAETLLLPLFSSALLLTFHSLNNPSFRNTSLTGLFWALAVLTKPNMQFLAFGTGILLTVSIFHRKIPVKRSLLIAPGFWLAMVLIFFPWLVRNKVQSSRWIISSVFEENVARVAAVATQAEIDGIRVEPWTETWEYIYDVMVMQTSLHAGWLYSSEYRFNCNTAVRRQQQISQAARYYVSHHLNDYIIVHLRGVMKSLLNPGHHLWYLVITGEPWSSTGVVSDIWARVAWSLKRRAFGDALHAFVSQRIIQIPFIAGAIWWALCAARFTLWCVVSHGIWCLRKHPWLVVSLIVTLFYIVILPGPIAHDRFYMPAVPIIAVITSIGLIKGGK